MQIFWVLILITVFSFLWHAVWRTRQETARQLYFNRLAMPVLLLPDSPFDSGFSARIEGIQRALEASGNTFNVRIIATPYYAPVGDLQTINKSFDMYVLLQVQAWLEAREQVAATAYKAAPDAAFEVIAGAKKAS